MNIDQLNKFFTTFVLNIELTWRLFFDFRVPLLTKIIFLIITSLYLISPIDLMPDILPAVGQLDDLLLFVFFMFQFVKACPEDLVEEHKGMMLSGDWKIGFLKYLITKSR